MYIKKNPIRFIFIIYFLMFVLILFLKHAFLSNITNMRSEYLQNSIFSIFNCIVKIVGMLTARVAFYSNGHASERILR